jgi:hypothetical protein
MFYEDDRVNEAAERCARLESWLLLENDPAKREQIEKALADAKDVFKAESERAAKEKAERDAAAKADATNGAAMFSEGSVTDFLKKFDEAAAEKKGVDTATNGNEATAEREASANGATAVEAEGAAQVRELVRELEPPADITQLPEYKERYEEAMARYQAVMEEAIEIAAAEVDNQPAPDLPHAPESEYEDVPELAAGEDIQGAVVGVVRQGGQTFYVVRNDEGAMASLAADENCPELEVGDEVCASRDQHGTYDVSQDSGYGM